MYFEGLKGCHVVFKIIFVRLNPLPITCDGYTLIEETVISSQNINPTFTM